MERENQKLKRQLIYQEETISVLTSKVVKLKKMDPTGGESKSNMDFAIKHKHIMQEALGI
jgi:hypothetical protein